jgi:hypothetical protein
MEKVTIAEKTAAAILEAAKKVGIKETKLVNVLPTYAMPEKGKFTDVIIMEDTEQANGVNTSHIALECTDDKTGLKSFISIGALQRMVYVPKENENVETIKAVEKESARTGNKYYTIEGSKSLNPLLGGSHPDIAAMLYDKNFTSKIVDCFVVDFAKKVPVAKTGYIVDVKKG